MISRVCKGLRVPYLYSPYELHCIDYLLITLLHSLLSRSCKIQSHFALYYVSLISISCAPQLHCFDNLIGFGIGQADNAANYAATTMRGVARLAICTSILLIVPLWLLKSHCEDLWHQYDVSAYVVSAYEASWLPGEGHVTPNGTKPSSKNSSDKVIVMARLEQEDTSWVAEMLPE